MEAASSESAVVSFAAARQADQLNQRQDQRLIHIIA
jgi:hypothetical protein